MMSRSRFEVINQVMISFQLAPTPPLRQNAIFDGDASSGRTVIMTSFNALCPLLLLYDN